MDGIGGDGLEVYDCTEHNKRKTLSLSQYQTLLKNTPISTPRNVYIIIVLL